MQIVVGPVKQDPLQVSLLSALTKKILSVIAANNISLWTNHLFKYDVSFDLMFGIMCAKFRGIQTKSLGRVFNFIIAEKTQKLQRSTVNQESYDYSSYSHRVMKSEAIVPYSDWLWTIPSSLRFLEIQDFLFWKCHNQTKQRCTDIWTYHILWNQKITPVKPQVKLAVSES